MLNNCLLLTTVVFEDMGNKTNVRLLQVPLDATDAATLMR